MDIFKGLFRNFFRSNQPGRNYNNKTPYKVQVMLKGFTGMNVECAGRVYRLLVPKRLYDTYAVYKEHVDNKKKIDELTPMERTHLYGYLNPKYHAANYPRKRVH